MTNLEQQQVELLRDRARAVDQPNQTPRYPISIRISLSRFNNLCDMDTGYWCVDNNIGIDWTYTISAGTSQVIACFATLHHAVLWKLRWGQDSD